VGKPTVTRLNVIGFEKVFASLTEGIDELGRVWPETGRILSGPLGDMLTRYTLTQMTDAALSADWKLYHAGGGKVNVGADGKINSFANLVADRGRVYVASWIEACFGWEPTKDGFLFFIESWLGRSFHPESSLRRSAETNGWRRVLEHPRLLRKVVRTKGRRRVRKTLHPRILRRMDTRVFEDALALHRDELNNLAAGDKVALDAKVADLQSGIQAGIQQEGDKS